MIFEMLFRMYGWNGVVVFIWICVSLVIVCAIRLYSWIKCRNKKIDGITINCRSTECLYRFQCTKWQMTLPDADIEELEKYVKEAREKRDEGQEKA